MANEKVDPAADEAPEPIIAPEVPAPPVKAAPEPHPAVAICTAWWNEQVHGSPVGQFTPGYNHLLDAFEDLKRRLAAGL